MPDSSIELLTRLRAAEPSTRLAALYEVSAQPAPPVALVLAVETLAASDSDDTVRRAALDVLRAPGVQSLYRTSRLAPSMRGAFVQQIDRWLREGLLRREQAEALRRRFDFDLAAPPLAPEDRRALSERIIRWQEQGLVDPAQAIMLSQSLQDAPPVPSVPAASPASTIPQPATGDPAPATPAAASAAAPDRVAPSPTFLFSDLSIRVFLYLGGFLVVAAALILAALVEVARLPILLALTAAAGVASAALRKRLPLPAFVLFVIFASLIPIDARVFIDLLDLTGPTRMNTWAVVWALVAVVLVIGSLVFRSRLSSVLALFALDTALVFTTHVNQDEDIITVLLLFALAAIAGLYASRRIEQWAEGKLPDPARFAVPLRLTSLIQAVILLIASAPFVLLAWVAPEEVNLPTGFTFAAGMLALAVFFYLVPRWGRPNALMPWLSVIALTPVPFLLLTAFDAGEGIFVLGLALGGAIFAAAGHLLDLLDGQLKPYADPLLTGSLALFVWSSTIAAGHSQASLFAVLLAAAISFTALHALKPRRPAWFAGLLAWLATFLVFFTLPFMEPLDVHPLWQFLLAAALLLLPDFLPLSAEADQRWRVPARWISLLPLAVNVFIFFILTVDAQALLTEQAAAIWAAALTGLLLVLYALRKGWVWVIYAGFAHLTAALIMFLLLRDTAEWLPWLGGMAVLFYLAGLLIGQIQSGSRWASALRWYGLGLGVILLGRAPYEDGVLAGLSLAAAGALFLVELLYLQGADSPRRAWLELPGMALLAAAFLVLPVGENAAHWSLALAGAAMTVLVLDLLFTRRLSLRIATNESKEIAAFYSIRWLVRSAGAVLVLAATAFIFFRAVPVFNQTLVLDVDLHAGWGAAIFLVFAAYLGLAARQYPAPMLGYPMTAFLALAVFFALRAFDRTEWLWAEVILAALLYGASFARRGPSGDTEWTRTLRRAGLGLAMLAALTAPLEDTGLSAAVWVALAATLYAVEAFRSRNVWLGFPANGLYLLAYFLILLELEVDQPQFYSLGVAILGLLMHYLLVRAGSKLGAFLTGMVSQLVLLGTTYIQMVNTEQLGYFAALFFQGLVVLAYGIMLRSRSLVFTPLVFIILGVVTVVLSVLSGIPTAIIIGCTGLFLLALGIVAVLLRERLGETFSSWRA